jgi:hypothetical protein
MVYQGKICIVQFTKLFSTSLPKSKTIQSKYEPTLPGTKEKLSPYPLFSSEFIKSLKRKILKQEIIASE